MADTTDEALQTNPLAELNTGFLRDMLVVIDGFDDDPSGQEILTAMRESGYPDCSHGRLYPNIDRLVDNGYVEKGEIDRRTNWHALTPKAEKRLEEYAEFVGGE